MIVEQQVAALHQELFNKLAKCLLKKPAALLLHIESIGVCLMLGHHLHWQCLICPCDTYAFS